MSFLRGYLLLVLKFFLFSFQECFKFHNEMSLNLGYKSYYFLFLRSSRISKRDILDNNSNLRLL